jgi:hypothetical protein
MDGRNITVSPRSAKLPAKPTPDAKALPATRACFLAANRTARAHKQKAGHGDAAMASRSNYCSSLRMLCDCELAVANTEIPACCNTCD